MVDARQVVIYRMVLMLYAGFSPVVEHQAINPMLWQKGGERVYVGLG